MPGDVALAGKPKIYTGLVRGVAVGGYDPVAYFTKGKAVPGKSSISLSHQGVNWRFSSEQNRTAFQRNPAKYAPQFGGYCAYAVANGYTAKGDPKAWSVVGGKLYLNYNKSVRAQWKARQSEYIQAGRKNWPGVLQ